MTAAVLSLERVSKSRAVVVVGSINTDLTVHVDRHPTPGETLLGSGGTVTAGGKGANQAVAAARLGAPTALVGAVGDDGAAAAATALLRSSGVDLGSVAEVGEPTGRAIVTVSSTGENTIVVVPGANAAVTPDLVDQHADVITAAGLCVLQGELPAETTTHAIRCAADAGVRILLNLAPVPPLPADVIALADPLVVNEHEARHTLQLLGGNPPACEDDPVRTANELSTALLEAGPRSVVVTLGAAGAVAASEGTLTHLPAPRVSARDTTGAGDAFVGALAVGLIRGEPLGTAATRAVRVGAYSVQRAGAQRSFPTMEEVLP